MAFEATYLASGAELRFSGVVTGDEILEAKREFFAHEFPDEARYVICDFTAAVRFEIPSDAVTRIVEQDRDAMDDHPHLLEAVIAPQPVAFGLSRMWQMKVDEVRPHTGVVRTRAEAIRWLEAAGLPVAK